MQLIGYHTERVAASGRRRASVCDAVLFTGRKSYLVEVKSTKEKFFSVQKGLHGIIEACEKVNILPLIAIYFKSSHSSEGSGRWVLKIITKDLEKVKCDDRSDEI